MIVRRSMNFLRGISSKSTTSRLFARSQCFDPAANCHIRSSKFIVPTMGTLLVVMVVVMVTTAAIVRPPTALLQVMMALLVASFDGL